MKLISVDEEVHKLLLDKGKKGETFNQILRELLNLLEAEVVEAPEKPKKLKPEVIEK